jgi:hypothetical protein
LDLLNARIEALGLRDRGPIIEKQAATGREIEIYRAI